MSKICVFLAEGMEEIEALTVVDLCRRAGIELSTVSITDSRMVTSSHGITVQADEVLSDINFDEVDMIVLPGGMPGTLNLEACQLLMEQVEAFDKQGKYLAAICAAPSIFGHKGMLEGRSACCYPSFETELRGAQVSRNPVEVSGHIITSRGMGTAIDFALSIVARMKGQSCADEIKKAIIYQQ
ncbi:MAG: DJ-1/PfpI family protein [Lachnospiraceae bacterium]|nr:DJ-1/PfpI family protein [Lachnospiraceae bacterium]